MKKTILIYIISLTSIMGCSKKIDPKINLNLTCHYQSSGAHLGDFVVNITNSKLFITPNRGTFSYLEKIKNLDYKIDENFININFITENLNPPSKKLYEIKESIVINRITGYYERKRLYLFLNDGSSNITVGECDQMQGEKKF